MICVFSLLSYCNYWRGYVRMGKRRYFVAVLLSVKSLNNEIKSIGAHLLLHYKSELRTLLAELELVDKTFFQPHHSFTPDDTIDKVKANLSQMWQPN